MTNLLEITGNDISQLADDDLRVLIGLLCEAEYREAGLPTKGILYGGNQDAPDGGLDVYVCDKDIMPPKGGFVPRSMTGFQVKKPDMTKAKVKTEMKPGGELREIIKDLIKEKGAYIIVSSGASVPGLKLKDRIDPMRDAVSQEDGNHDLHLDFYDQGRIATWVRSHPSLILWVRNRIGRQLKGWRPYENWANPRADTEEKFLSDKNTRLHDGTKPKDANAAMSILEGIQALRSLLNVPGTSVRLTGLSGVGKTRLAQALFDDRIADSPLNLFQVFYTDISYGPEPDPKTFAEQLIAGRTRAFLIVDNCPPELHNLITKTCSTERSTVSLLTIEYDVRDDLPEETNVFRLEPASKDIIQELIHGRYKHISQVDTRTIAEFSGGNARIAIALANTMKKGETLSGLRDESLFERLFQQRHESDADLLMSAEALSLVYSFDGIDTCSDKSELNVLAPIIGKTAQQLYRDVNELKDRDLIQSRDKWRAVLPHAIANRLAKRALESIPKDTIIDAFINRAPERLIKSFSRRLGYLHDCDQAVGITEDWLEMDGWLGKANCNFNDLGIEAFKNIAPVSPKKSLEMMERVADGDKGNEFTSRDQNYNHDIFVRTLRHIAYDADLFDRAVEIISRFALSEKADENNNSSRAALKSLFFIHLSGTHASIEQRASIIEDLVNSGDQDKQELGVFLLEAAIQASHFTTSYDFDFGARSRDFGYKPRTAEDVQQWFEAFLGICTRIAISDKPIAENAKKIFASNMRGLWMRAHVYDIIEKSISEIHRHKAWNEGWIAVKQIIQYHYEKFEEDIKGRITELEKSLRPDSLYEVARTFALSDEHISFDISDDPNADEAKGWDKAMDRTKETGIKVAKDEGVLNALLPDLVSTFSYRIRAFGWGLGAGSPDRKSLWQALYSEYVKTDISKRNTSAMEGFLSACAENEPELYNSILDSLIEDEALGELFPFFQITSTIDKCGIERINRALDLGRAKTVHFSCLAYGRVHESIDDDDLAVILKKILTKEDGINVAVEILKMRFYKKKDSADISEKLIDAGRETLCMYFPSDRRERHGNKDHALSILAKLCLSGDGGIPATEKVCQNFLQAIITNMVYSFDYPNLLGTICDVQPYVFLNTFIENDQLPPHLSRRMFTEDINDRIPIDKIPDEVLIDWCEKAPERRYNLIASSIRPFIDLPEEGAIKWRPIIFKIMDKAPVLEEVFQHFTHSIEPSSWSGSRADIMQRRTELLKELFQHENLEIVSLAKAKYSKLQKRIRDARSFEESQEYVGYQSFE